MSLLFAHDTLILDADCVISLYASGQMGEILAAIPRSITVTTYVAEREALWIWGEPDPAGVRPKHQIELQPFIDQGLLHLVQIDSEEEAEVFATFAAMIRGQGEAITGALAYCRNWAIVVDDRRARRLFTDHAPHLQLLYTLDLVKHWTDSTAAPSNLTTQALRNIRHRATYRPAADHPLFGWWRMLGGD
ncbi:MAG TPA: hypothetical protein PKE45_11215 [Caldilineaceae bacterium]|nr:hypothetical protein [Caldilineaceae bacterium]